MTEFIAALPMYDWPEAKAEVDAEWASIRDRLRAAGIGAPDALVRTNSELPPVPGGIRDAAGKIIAPDPATLPPHELDFQTLWKHPGLLFAQTCWGPMELGLGEHVRVVGQPDYSAYEGGAGEFYSSAIVMRRGSPPPLRGEPVGANHSFHAAADVSAPADGRPFLPLEQMRGKCLAFNSQDSMSGVIALRRDLDAAGESLAMFSQRIATGGHRASVVAVAEGRADVAAVDCRTWDLIKRFEPAASGVRVAGWTARRKGLPYISSLVAPAYSS